MSDEEFISKYHTQKVLKFEPPTWEEFLETRDISKHIQPNWECGDIEIIMYEENNRKGIMHTSNTFEIFNDNTWEQINYYNDDFFDNREEMYYKALDVAKKWFLGEDK